MTTTAGRGAHQAAAKSLRTLATVVERRGDASGDGFEAFRDLIAEHNAQGAHLLRRWLGQHDVLDEAAEWSLHDSIIRRFDEHHQSSPRVAHVEALRDELWGKD